MLNENQLAIRATARQFAQKELAPSAAKRDRDASFPKDAFRRMGGLGLLGMLVSKENGGAAADTVSYALATMEIAAADGATSTAFQVHNALVNVPIERFGTADQRERFLPSLAAGRQLGCFCPTEADTGSDPAARNDVEAARSGQSIALVHIFARYPADTDGACHTPDRGHDHRRSRVVVPGARATAALALPGQHAERGAAFPRQVPWEALDPRQR